MSASRDETIKVWDLDSGCMLSTLEGHAGEVSACAVTPDGRRVVSAAHDERLKVWDLDTHRVSIPFEGHRSGVSACTVTPDGRRVVSTSGDGMKVWDVASGRLLDAFDGDDGGSACAGDARRPACGRSDR